VADLGLELDRAVADPDAVVGGVTADSRLVQPGDLYVALPGSRHHGAEFAPTALAAGAVAVLTDGAGAGRLPGSEPVLVVDDPRGRLAELAARIYGRPADALQTYAITGTNGKTTTSFLLEAVLRGAGQRVGVIGTIGFRLAGEPLAGPRNTVTTPEAPELQALLAVMAERGADAVVMEVSSHALALGRTDAIRFDVAAFTNLGRDHLDFHGDVESYFEAKARLFTPEHTRVAVLNVDDPRGAELARRVGTGGEPALVSVSLDDPDADYRIERVEARRDGSSRVDARTPAGPLHFDLTLPGDYNLRNALTALAMADSLGVDLSAGAAGLAAASVSGRMQRVALPAGAPRVLVDFAHTPQAVTAVLAAVGGAPGGRRIVVLGCGGDRDPVKRRPMGAAAAAADLVVVTDDNPRSEEPEAIRAEVLAGARAEVAAGRSRAEVVDGGDRRSAIRLALAAAGPGDVVAVLGKGHESGQEIGGRLLPFDDVAVVEQEWAELAAVPRVAR
jgi:UDP-N-acetylmuramoyl-L-alanyl-D-glutamate--2,6-diaminopimelate ligase